VRVSVVDLSYNEVWRRDVKERLKYASRKRSSREMVQAGRQTVSTVVETRPSNNGQINIGGIPLGSSATCRPMSWIMQEITGLTCRPRSIACL